MTKVTSLAIYDINTERQRQINVEGWGPEHDSHHENNELVRAAVCYAFGGMHTQYGTEIEYILERWPFDRKWLKIRSGDDGRRRNLVIAGALIAAEIDRMDKAK